MSDRTRRLVARLSPAFLVLVAAPASAVEVQFEGFYRARARLYDTLSLDRDLAASEGTSAFVQHRLWLRPRFLINENVSLHTDLLGYQNAYWGDRQQPWQDPVTGALVPPAFVDDVATAPLPDEVGTVRAPDITFWRAWGEVRTPIGRFSVGRMPLHWGLGVWQNDGLGFNAEYGDSVDRAQWEHLVSDVWVRLAVDTVAQGLINEPDGTMAYNGIVAYRTENVVAGLQARYRRTGLPRRNVTAAQRALNLFTLDASAEAELGRVTARAEAIGQFGGGDLTPELGEVSVVAFGGVVDLQLATDAIILGVEAGLASGDGTPEDQRYTTFTFHRDYNVGIILFEQPLPTLAGPAATDPRSFELTATGPAVSNAMYLRPRVGRTLRDGLMLEGSLLAARTMRAPADDRSSYGFEIDAGVRWDPYDAVELGGTLGLFLPGTYFRNLPNELGGSFSDPVFGVQLITRIRF